MNFPTFDAPRLSPGIDGDAERHVQLDTEITMRVDETDEWINVPLRAVYTDDGLTGWTFEIGPFSVFGADAMQLVNMLAQYGDISGDFRRAPNGGVS